MGHTVGQGIHFLTQYGLITVVLTLILLAGAAILWPIGVWPLTAMTLPLRALLFMVIVISGLALWRLPPWQAARIGLEPMERFTAENEARKTLAQILGGVAVLLSLCVAWGTLEVNREGQITDRFTKAIAQLGEGGEGKLTIRLGGIYALERIARDSERDHWPVMEVLTTYVRIHAPWPSKDPRPLKEGPACMEELPSPSEFRLATDIQAVLTVLKRRTHTYENSEEQRLDLTNADLRTADLREAWLQGAILYDARLRGAYLQGARLKGAYLRGAQLQRACLWKTNLEGAHLQGAQLEEADFWKAQLQGATLVGARLKGAHNLTVEQLSTVKSLYQAELDPPLQEQIEQRYRPLLDPPPSFWDVPPSFLEHHNQRFIRSNPPDRQ